MIRRNSQGRAATLTTVTGLLLLLSGQVSLPAWGQTGGASISPKLTDGLSRWREIAYLVQEGRIPASRERAAAQVMAWGQMAEHFQLADDEEMRGLLESRVESPGFVEARLEAAVHAFDADDGRFADSTGTFFDAYVSSLDKSGQLYILHVPAGYTPQQSYPLVVRPAPYVKLTEVDPTDLEADYIVAACGGRGQNGIEGMGELDVLEVIAHVRKHYAVDPDRIYLSGGSIGGGGVWRMAARYPDLFAAARVDYGWSWTERLFLENASNLPMWLYHDAADIWVPVEESRVAVEALRRLAGPVLYNETSGGGHSRKLKDSSWGTDEWLLAQRREPFPERIHYTTTTARRGRAYWVDVLSFVDANKAADVRAGVIQGNSLTQLFLHLDNVDALAVDLPGELFARDVPLSVAVDGVRLQVQSPLPEQIYLHRTRDSGGFAISTSDPRPATAYRPYTSGGLHQLYLSGEPLLIVRGTGGDDPELLAAIERYCHLLSTRLTSWWPFPMNAFCMGGIPVKDDVAVTEEDLREYNLIVVGSVTTNRLLRRLAPQLPAVESDHLLSVGSEKYPLVGRGYGLYYHNPAAPECQIMVMSSDTPAFYETLLNGVADRAQDELPLGLVLVDVSPKRVVRCVAWDED